jgi:hypothetical protein
MIETGRTSPVWRNAFLPQAVSTPIISDSVTTFGADARGRVALAASHGGIYAAYLAAKAGLRAVILSDAGVGRERAGIGGLPYLDALGMPAAAVGHRSARIGDGADCLARGVITHVNARAAALGIAVGMPAREALDRLDAAEAPSALREPTPLQETRHTIEDPQIGDAPIYALDSASLVRPTDAGAIVLAASHGGLLGGRPEAALKVDAFAAIFNDADFGVDDAGVARIVPLDGRGIAGATVSAWSARIGDGLSTYNDGFVSAVNKTAACHGGEVGLSAIELVRRFAAARKEQQR